jgi:hypothetical protein
LTRASGCFTQSEFETCKSLGVEAAPAWGIDVSLPVSKHLGLHVAWFGVEGKRVQYSGLTAGLNVGRLR